MSRRRRRHDGVETGYEQLMGYMRHNAIVVSASYPVEGLDSEHWIEVAHREALRIFEDVAEVTEPTPVAVNYVRSFLIAPDGSKEGWDASDAGDAARNKFVEWLETTRYDDKSSPLDWVEVQYGDDDRETKVIRDNDARYR